MKRRRAWLVENFVPVLLLGCGILVGCQSSPEVPSAPLRISVKLSQLHPALRPFDCSCEIRDTTEVQRLVALLEASDEKLGYNNRGTPWVADVVVSGKGSRQKFLLRPSSPYGYSLHHGSGNYVSQLFGEQILDCLLMQCPELEGIEDFEHWRDSKLK